MSLPVRRKWRTDIRFNHSVFRIVAGSGTIEAINRRDKWCYVFPLGADEYTTRILIYEDEMMRNYLAAADKVY